MNSRLAKIVCVACVAVSVSFASSFGADANKPARFDGSDTENWLGWNLSDGVPETLSQPGEYIAYPFAFQAFPGPGEGMAFATNNSTLGAFYGDYRATTADRVVFRVYCPTVVPTSADIFLHNSNTPDRRWRFALSGMGVGAWVTYVIPLEFTTPERGSGWYTELEGETEAQFEEDLQYVDWTGVRFQRNGGSAQDFGVDDFVLADHDYDWDGDHMPDIAEQYVGTDEQDLNSVFKLTIDLTGGDLSAIVSWPSVPGDNFQVWREATPGAGPTMIGTTQATATVTSYVDTNAAGGPFYYSVIKP